MGDALIARPRREMTLVLRFARAEGVERRVRALVTLESECCPFLQLTVETSTREVVLRIDAPSDAATLLDEFF